MADERRRTAWKGFESDFPVVTVPDPIIRLLTDRKIAKDQKTVKFTTIGTGRFQIDQRDSEGAYLRKIVLEFKESDKTRARVNGYSILMFKVGEDWFPEELQFAIDAIAKEVILLEG